MLSSTASATGSLVISWDICHTRSGFMPPEKHSNNLIKVSRNVPVHVHDGQATEHLTAHAAPQICLQVLQATKGLFWDAVCVTGRLSSMCSSKCSDVWYILLGAQPTLPLH